MRHKLVSGLFFIILAFFLVIAKVTSDIISNSLRNNSYEHYQLLANDTAENVNAWLSSKKEIIENQRAALEIIGNFDHDFLTEFLGRAILGRRDLNEICDLYYLNTDNVLSTGNGYYVSPDIDLRKRDWYIKCLDTRDLYYSSPYLDVSTGNFVMTISAATHDKSGRFKGVLAIDIFIDAFLDAVNYAKVPDDSYLFLVDNEYGIAAHPYQGYAYIDNVPQPLSAIPGNIYSEIETDIVHGDYGMTVIDDYDGVRRDMFISNIDCCQWCIVAAVSENVLRSSEIIMIFCIIAALFVSLAVGILWTLVGTKKIMRQLEDAMEQANTANETKSSFLANMSHEIRTPINAVIGMNEMIMREDVSDSVREYALDIAASSRSLIGIINDILDFSKIESGKLEIIESEFNIASMVNDIVSMAVARIGEKPIELFVNIDPDIPVGIIGDEMRLKQVIVNILTNGIKYTNEGFVLLNVSYEKRDYGINLDVSVRDSGIGITPENIEKLFTSFQRVDTKRNRSVEGTGLGLAITKRLVGQMGGFVNVESKYGKGSVFSISVPLGVSCEKQFIRLKAPEEVHSACLFELDNMTGGVYRYIIREMSKRTYTDLRFCKDLEELRPLIDKGVVNRVFIDRYNYIDHERYFCTVAGTVEVILVQGRINAIRPSKGIKNLYKPFYAIPYAALINNENIAYSDLGRKVSDTRFIAPDVKVLIVDDNALNLKVAVGLMRPYKMKMQTADSGAKAVEMRVTRKDIDIVFMDHMMPGMDGIEAAAAIRSQEGEYFRKLPIIALTANTVNDARGMFLKAGFDEFLAKPIDVSALDKVLRKFIPEDRMVVSDDGGEPIKPKKAPDTDDMKDPPFFDPGLGVDYTGGDEELYLDVLTDYTKAGRATAEELNSLCAEQNWPEYIIKVHALKSTSLNIGAVQLSRFAKKLELSGKAGRTGVIADENAELTKMLGMVVETTGDYLSSKGIEIRPENGSVNISDLTEIGKEKLDDMIKRFLAACDGFDRNSAKTIAEEAGLFRYGDTVLSEYFGKAGKMIDDFEYEEAAELISGFKEKIS